MFFVGPRAPGVSVGFLMTLGWRCNTGGSSSTPCWPGGPPGGQSVWRLPLRLGVVISPKRRASFRLFAVVQLANWRTAAFLRASAPRVRISICQRLADPGGQGRRLWRLQVCLRHLEEAEGPKALPMLCAMRMGSKLKLCSGISRALWAAGSFARTSRCPLLAIYQLVCGCGPRCKSWRPCLLRRRLCSWSGLHSGRPSQGCSRRLAIGLPS